ncbi:porin [Parendozoicomonas haliclonae]|uniref:Outer membrane protein N n=1 Tax=Parendozoicomonas haliclonae TaxID=1960125 RepID=A0A1X7APX7_9GAMM|nr:porin [Parendozoicomonas haliclonae]SMA50346.1 Outer membrane protein N precursor [Parendozoicomonas haliclonae]
MKKVALAVAIAALSGQAMAAEIFDNGTTSASVGGRIGIKTETGAKSDDGMRSDSSRINFGFEHKLSENVTAFAKVEWSYDMQDDEGESFGERLGNIGLAHKTMGTVIVGKQWSAYSDVAGWTDKGLFNGGYAMGIYDGVGGHGTSGMGRADDAIGYRNSFGGLNVSAQYQLSDNGTEDKETFDRENGMQLAVSYDLPMGFSIGATVAETAYKATESKATDGTITKTGFDKDTDSTAQTFAVKYDNNGLYLAATMGSFEYIHEDAKESKGTEVYGQYSLNSVVPGLAVFSGYQILEVDKLASGADSKREEKVFSLGTEYKVGPMLFGLQYSNFDKKNDLGVDVEGDDDVYYATARYYF